jgi:hypothetical protein
MKKIVLAIAGSMLMIFSGLQVAAAAEHHHGKLHHRAYSEYRDSNAYAAPVPFYGPVAPSDAYRYNYNGDYSNMYGY